MVEPKAWSDTNSRGVAVKVVYARSSSANPMGQERYHDQVVKALGRRAEVEVVDRRIGGIRAQQANRRIPQAALERWSGTRFCNTYLYGRRDLLHRADLRLPPARYEVVTVLDVAPLRFGDEGAVSSRALRSVDHESTVVCCSAFSAQEAHEVFGVTRAVVAHAGVEQRFFDAKPLRPSERERLGLAGPYVLNAGGATQRKNLAALAAAWRHVAPDVEHTLALVGPHDERRDVLFAGVPRAHGLGRLPDDLMPSIVRSADAIVVPSVYEGFGLPALEGLAAGVPVVAVGRASLPEVVGDAGLLVEPDAEGLGEGILSVLRDEALRTRFSRSGPERAAHFTWAHTAKRHVIAYESVALASDLPSDRLGLPPGLL